MNSSHHGFGMAAWQEHRVHTHSLSLSFPLNQQKATFINTAERVTHFEPICGAVNTPEIHSDTQLFLTPFGNQGWCMGPGERER